MFGKIKSFFGRKNASAPTAKPQMATSRLQQPEVATRSRSAAVMAPPSAESVMAAKRQSTATDALRSPSPAAVTPSRPAVSAPAVSRSGAEGDHQRTQKSMKRGERVKAQDFMAVATAGGSRDLRAAKTKEVKLITKQGEADGMTMRHRSGSVTELHLAPDSSKVTAAKHFSKTTGKVTEVREAHMRGPAQKQLTKVAARNDRRGD